jgi:outer membrane lipoprotein LolB
MIISKRFLLILLSLTTHYSYAHPQSWKIFGAIAAKNNKQSWTASLNWRQSGPNNYQIRLFGPLNGKTVLIEHNKSIITYNDGRRKISSNNADKLLQEQTGIRLPINNLYYWIRGLTAPGSIQSAHYDAHQYLISFTQAGYKIKYTAYTETQGIILPSKILLQSNDILIKLIIKNWTII